MAVNFHDGAESSSISPLSFIGDSFHNNEGRHFSFLDDVSLMGCDRPATSSNSREGSNSIDSSGSYRRRIQGLERPSNPAPPSFSSQSSSSSSHMQLLTGVCVTPLELIQQSRAYRNRPPNNIYVRRCHSTQFHKGTDQRMTSPSSLQQELQLLINHRREILTSLATINENASTQKLELLCKLAAASGDARNPTFVAIVVQLGELRKQRRQHLTNLRNVESILQRLMKDTPNISPGLLYKNIYNEVLEGQWLTLTKPTYTDCLGFNDEGDPMYRLGRMSFEMFFPGDLICAIQAVFNPISKVAQSSNDSLSFSIPKALQEEVKLDLDNDDTSLLRTYHIVVAFTIEPYSPSFGQDSPNRIVSSPIKGIMTTYGYVLPDPTTPDRLSVWFAGGKISCGEDKTSHEFHIWKEIFGYPVTKKGRLRRRRRTFREGAMVFAAHMMMGAKGYDEPMDEDTGELSYTFTRPVGGHAKNYVDILHLDDNIRVMRGHAGTTYTFARLRS